MADFDDFLNNANKNTANEMSTADQVSFSVQGRLPREEFERKANSPSAHIETHRKLIFRHRRTRWGGGPAAPQVFENFGKFGQIQARFQIVLGKFGQGL